jgi:hypothetical protein
MAWRAMWKYLRADDECDKKRDCYMRGDECGCYKTIRRRALTESINNQFYFCFTVKVFPAIVIVALRPDGPAFGATE